MDGSNDQDDTLKRSAPGVGQRLLRLGSSSGSRRGPRRVLNEDAFLDQPQAGLFCVADGMGGHADGHLASQAITRILEHAVDADAPIEHRIEQVEDAVASINAALRREAQKQSGRTIIGSTVVVLLIGDGYAACLWAGDSRAYLARAGSLYQLTKDHATPHRTNVVTRAVGSHDTVKLDRVIIATELGDTYLLCSDGVSGVVEADTILEILSSYDDHAADRLIGQSVSRSGRDDMTAVVVHIPYS